MAYRIKGFIETSFSDWPGKVVSVLFLPSCNFRCLYCHNHELVLHPEKFPDYPWEAILEGMEKRKGWIDGVCVTGGEPTLHAWLPSLFRELRASRNLTPDGRLLGIKLDTNGTHPEVIEALIEEGLLDYVAMDLKGPLERERYAAITGVSYGEEQIDRLRATIQILLKGKVAHEFRTTLVPGLIEEEEVYSLARQVRGAQRYTLQNFNPRETLQESLKMVPAWDSTLLQKMQKKVNEIIRELDKGKGKAKVEDEVKVKDKVEETESNFRSLT